MEQLKEEKPQPRKREEAVDATVAQEAGKAAVREQKIKEMDDMLDEIDEVLGLSDKEAQEFVSSYIQKGGE